MARLIAALLRHGDYRQPAGVPSAHLPYPLTEKGRRQARESATHLGDAAAKEGCRIHPVIDCSRMLRGWQTATILADAFTNTGVAPATVESFDHLAERSLGAAANLTVDEIDAVIDADPRFDPLPQGWKADSFFCLPLQGAESLMQAGERAAAHVAARVSELADTIAVDTVKVFVGHGGALRHAAVHLGILTADEARALSMYHCRPVFLERLAAGPWRHAGGSWKKRGPTGEHPG